MRIFALMQLCLLCLGCANTVPDSTEDTTTMSIESFDVQGHRGARGLLPENTIPAFIRALDLGVTTLELDVVISKDNKVVVSHEPWLSSEICLKPDGTSISKKEEKALNVYNLTYEEISRFDCGSAGNKRFPRQERMKVSKPLLSDVIDAAERYAETHDLAPVRYNIETKSRPETDNLFHPPPDVFTKLVVDIFEEKGIMERAILQSFDVRTLQAAHRLKPKLSLALLVSNHQEMELDAYIDRLGFIPSIYSPNYTLLEEGIVQKAHEYGMAVIPWTVNTLEDMETLKRMGVDGIITDYPDLGIQLLGNME